MRGFLLCMRLKTLFYLEHVPIRQMSIFGTRQHLRIACKLVTEISDAFEVRARLEGVLTGLFNVFTCAVQAILLGGHASFCDWCSGPIHGNESIRHLADGLKTIQNSPPVKAETPVIYTATPNDQRRSLHMARFGCIKGRGHRNKSEHNIVLTLPHLRLLR
jgi:hypothetical protein